MSDGDLGIRVYLIDQATAGLKGIAGRVKSILTAPLTASFTSLRALFNRIFSLRGVLVGGALTAAIREIDKLAIGYTKFQEVFSDNTQERINSIASALSRLGAQFRTVLGNAAASNAEGVTGIIDSLTEFLASHQADIVDFFKSALSFFRDGAVLMQAFFRYLFDGVDKLSDKTRHGSDWLDSLGIIITQGIGDAGRAVKTGIAQIAGDIRREKLNEAIKEAFGLDDKTAGGAVAAMGQIALGLTSVEKYANLTTDQINLARVALKAYDDEIEKVKTSDVTMADAERAAYDAVTKVLEGHARAVREVAKAHEEGDKIVANKTLPTLQQLSDKYDDSSQRALQERDAQIELARKFIDSQVIIAGYLKIGDLVDTFGNQFDNAFDSIVDGTKNVGQAIGQMVTGAIRDLAKLELSKVFKDLLRLGFGAIFGGGDAFSSIFSGGKAVGGTADRGGGYVVGERGPEKVYLPRGARVNRTDQGGRGGGINIQVNGARDPIATAKEIVAMIKVNGQLREAIRGLS